MAINNINETTKLESLFERTKIKTNKQVKEIVNLFFFQNISYKALKVKLSALRDLEFFFRFKKDQIIQVTPEQIDYYYENFRERRYFFRKFSSFLNITLILLGHYFQNHDHLKSFEQKALEQLYHRLMFFIEEITVLGGKKSSGKEEEIRLHYTQIACIFNILVYFLRELFQITEYHGEWRF